ncbi:MAG TPA: carboxypeptidase regulatory-like domain-containing protein [Acidobacteriaceae bacterium]
MPHRAAESKRTHPGSPPIRQRHLIHRAFCATILALSLAAHAQSAAEGGLAGTVTDTHGAALADAVLLLTNTATAAEISTGTDARGQFQLPALDPGEYNLRAAASGFAPQQATVTVRVGELAVFRIKLSGSASHADAGAIIERPINSASASSSQITLQEIRALPADGRRWSNLALLTPGASPDASSGRGLISFRGLPSILNNNLVDGSDDNQEFFASARGRTRAAYTFTQESVHEFQVLASNYAAQYGGPAGGTLNMVTRSGGKSLHGSLFYSLRDSRLAAHNPFSTFTSFNAATATATTILVKPYDQRQQWGGSISGPANFGRHPIFGGALFYFYAFDQQHRDFPAASSPQSPQFYSLIANQTALLRNNRGLTMAKINAALGYLSSLGGTLPRLGNQTVNFPKLDWVRSRQHASLQYNRMRWNSPAGVQTQTVVARGLASFGNDSTKVDTVQARWQAGLGPRLINDLRAQYSRDFEFESPQQPLPQEPATAPGGYAPQVSISPDGFTFGTPRTVSRAAYPDERRQAISDQLTLVRGHHLLAAGITFNRVDERISNLLDAEGSYRYSPRLLLANGEGQPNGLADWITDFTFSANSYPSGGCPAVEGGALHYFCFRSFTQGFGPHESRFTLRQWSGFVQDEWQLLRRVHLSFGVRYELEQLPAAQHPNAALDAAFGAIGSTSTLPADRNNFAPRFGLAWSPGNKGRTVLRAGYGVFYGRVAGATVRSALMDTAVSSNGQPISAFHIRITPTTEVGCGPGGTAPCSCPPGSDGFGYPCTFTSLPVGIPAVANTTSTVFFDHHFRLPMIQEGSFSLEHEFPASIIVSAGYLMSLSRQLPNFVDVNIAPSTTLAEFQSQGGPFDGQIFFVPKYTARANANFGPVTDILSNVSGSYNALVLQARKRLQPGVELRVHWTWSKALDFGQSSAAVAEENAQFDPFHVRYDKALSSLNYPHRIALSMVLSPRIAFGNRLLRAAVNGWQFAPVFTESSGRPYSYQIRGGTSLNGGRLSINGAGGALYLPSVGRNTLRLPDTTNLNLRLARRGRIGPRVRLSGSAELFNALNHTNYSRVNTTAYDVGPTTTGVTKLIFQSAAVNPVTPFGQRTGAATSLTRERQVQFSLRAEF